ncbi:MAG: FUSC family protein [Streptosporangiaceae bacterium]
MTLRAAGCLALFSVLAVPVFGLAGVFPAGTGVAFVLGALLIGPLRWNQGTAVALAATAVTMATLAVSSLAGRAMATIVLLVVLASLGAGLAAHRGWHTALVAAPACVAIFSAPVLWRHQLGFAGAFGVGALLGLVALRMIPASAGARELPIGTEASWLFASVLAAFAGLAMLLAERLGMPHGYWMTLTILSVLQPDVHVTRARTSARVVGSVLGSLAALAVAVRFHDHDLLVLIGIIVACVATVLVASYQWKVALYTMMLIFFDASTSTPFRIAGERVALTVAAAGAVAAFCVAVPELLRRLPPDVRADLGDDPERVPDPDTRSSS